MNDRYIKSRKRPSGSSSGSTEEYYGTGPPQTSGRGHQTRGKQHHGGPHLKDDVAYNFRPGFSEAQDSLGHIERQPAELGQRLREIQERAKNLPKGGHSNPTKRKKTTKESPLEIAEQEQAARAGRQESRTSLYGSHSARHGIEMDFDSDVQDVSKSHTHPRRPESRDKSMNAERSDLDNTPIPRKTPRNQFGIKNAPKEKQSNDKRNQGARMNSYPSKDSFSDDKHNARGKTAGEDAIDLCSDGETDSEDIYTRRSKCDRTASSRTTDDAIESDQSSGKVTRKPNKEVDRITQTLSAIRNDKPFVPQNGLSFTKAPSSSEGRKLKGGVAIALPDKAAGTERTSPLKTIYNSLTRTLGFGGKKIINAGRPIVPGDALRSGIAETRNEQSLKSNNKRAPSIASLESNKSATTPIAHSVPDDSTDDDLSFKWSSDRKSTAKKTKKNCKNNDFYDDYSPTNSAARKNSSNRDQTTPSSNYRTRSSARKSSMKGAEFAKRQNNEVVDMLDDSDDEQSTLACFDVARIAIGSSVKHQDCQIKIFNDGFLSCSYSVRSKERIHNIDFANGEVDEVFFYVDNTVDLSERLPSSDDAAVEPGSFIALNVQKTKSNGFSSISSYVPGEPTEERGLILVEFRSDGDMSTFLKVVQEHKPFLAYFSKGRLSRDFADLYSKALAADAKKEALSRNKKVKSTNRTGFLAGKGSADLLLRFPFGDDQSVIDAAATGLAEFQCPPCTAAREDEADLEVDMNSSSVLLAAESNEENRRRHHVEIRVEDFERLDPGVYLNDTLIDFFLQWMTRKHVSRDLHVFTTHFYTTLEDNGAEGVSNWTTKKKIDVFKLKFIYIPINKTLHWSFCVIVNPGEILSHMKRQERDVSGGDAPMPCLIFFDSLKMHQKDRVHRNIMKWLNAEWRRLGKSSSERAPFSRSSFPVLTPKVTFQNNSWDCGVFVCRYASGIFQLRNRMFSYKELKSERGDVIGMITNGDEFKFSLKDIANLRDEMKILIERLSHIYLPWKANMDNEERLKKLAESNTKSESDLNPEEKKPDLYGKGKLQDSPDSLLTQDDCDAIESQIAKENVDSQVQKFHMSETMDINKQFGNLTVDRSPSDLCDAVDAFMSNYNPDNNSDSASV